MMTMSENITDLAKALCKAQSLIENAVKDTRNDFFKSRYADLASVWAACRKPLTDNGLSIVQALGSEDNKVKCTTMLLHESGQYIKSEFMMTPQQNTPQAVGSCSTYLRRYALQAIVGVAPDDDDGNLATQKGTSYESKNNSAGTKAMVDTNTKSHVDKTTAKDVPDNNAAHVSKPATPPVFNKSDTTHLRWLQTFLNDKERYDLFDKMCNRMTGKLASMANFEAEYLELCK